MLSELDENSTYLSPKDLTAFNEALDRQFAGIGVTMIADAKSKQLVVGSPVANSPASRAGIRVGDRILRIDDTGTRGMSLHEAFLLLRGEPQTTVTLSVLHQAPQSRWKSPWSARTFRSSRSSATPAIPTALGITSSKATIASATSASVVLRTRRPANCARR